MRNACVALRNVSYLDRMPSEVAGIRAQLLVEEMVDQVIPITIAIVYELLRGPVP
jgi:hypothetical protein